MQVLMLYKSMCTAVNKSTLTSPHEALNGTAQTRVVYLPFFRSASEPNLLPLASVLPLTFVLHRHLPTLLAGASLSALAALVWSPKPVQFLKPPQTEPFVEPQHDEFGDRIVLSVVAKCFRLGEKANNVTRVAL